jgi:predicted dehydrogenase
MSDQRLGIGFVGSGFVTQFHIRAMVGVRDAEVRGIWSPNAPNATAAAALARELEVGPARPYDSIEAMVADPGIDALWICGPNHARVANVEAVVTALRGGAGTLKAIACEKPLARNVAEAKRVLELVESVGLNHGYLENQLFAPQVERGRELVWARGAALTGRPYLARAAEEHSGPHMPWFWSGALQGGGVLNDMMCHSVEVVRHLLTAPGAPRDSIRPVRVTGHIASLKWTRPEYRARLLEMTGGAVDYGRTPAEDFASVTIEFETAEGLPVIGEATTSWSFVGPGLRLSAELLGPEYSMAWDSLSSGLDLFFSRRVTGAEGEDLVEKQNAEVGQMPVVANEWVAYGYEAEDRHFVRSFLRDEKPLLTFHDGVEVARLLMTSYRSAEEGRTLEFPPDGIDSFVPAVARGEWNPILQPR